MADHSLSPVLDVVCVICGAGSRLDEHNRCERCVFDGETLAVVLQDLESWVQATLDQGLARDEVRQAVELMLEHRDGVVANVPRRRVPTREGGLWEQHPRSSFLSVPDRAPNELRHLRVCSGWTLEDVADDLGVDASTVALWEQGAEIPDSAAEVLAKMFGVKPCYLTGEGS
jgi:DNA-binding transcriptional regulator YiaG